MTVVLIGVGAIAGAGALLTLVVWLIGRTEARHEAREREDMRTDPPTLGGAYRPRHYRRMPPT